MARVNYVAYINSPMWREKRRQAFAYYGAACVVCGATRGLHVHHLTYIRLGDELMEDLEIRCEPCHEDAHPERDRKDRANLPNSMRVRQARVAGVVGSMKTVRKRMSKADRDWFAGKRGWAGGRYRGRASNW